MGTRESKRKPARAGLPGYLVLLALVLLWLLQELRPTPLHPRRSRRG